MTKDAMYKRIRQACSGSTPYPEYGDGLAESPARLTCASDWDNFCERFTASHGIILNDLDSLAGLLEGQHLQRGYLDPALPAAVTAFLEGRFSIEQAFQRDRIDDYQFSITMAHGAVAETGAIIMRDTEAVPRLAALAPWVHVACIDAGHLFRTVSDAICDLGDDPNTVWIAGPSKTADVEGVLIEGVHGPGIQGCMMLSAP